jgi:hypothetical protein
MGDRVYASIRIGGHLETVEEAESLVGAIVAEGLKDLHSDARIDDEAAAQANIRLRIEGNAFVDLHDTEVKYGSFNHIEAAIRLLPRMWCSTSYESGGDFDAGIATIFHADGNATEHSCETSDGDPVVRLSRLKSAAQHDDERLAAIVKGIIEELGIAAGEDLPPLTASPAVSTWLKIVAEKVA